MNPSFSPGDCSPLNLPAASGSLNRPPLPPPPLPPDPPASTVPISSPSSSSPPRSRPKFQNSLELTSTRSKPMATPSTETISFVSLPILPTPLTGRYQSPQKTLSTGQNPNPKTPWSKIHSTTTPVNGRPLSPTSIEGPLLPSPIANLASFADFPELKASTSNPAKKQDFSQKPTASQPSSSNQPKATAPESDSWSTRVQKNQDKTLKRLAPTTISPNGIPRVKIPESVFTKGADLHKDFVIA